MSALDDAQESLGGTPARAKVLLVDDRPENLLSLKAILEGREHDILTADSGPEGLTLALEHDFAVILLDVQMPVMNGFEVAEFLQSAAQTKRIPIIFVTAISHDRVHVERGYRVGAVDYLFKPLDPNIVKSKVDVFLKLYRQKQLIEQTSETLRTRLDQLKEAMSALQNAHERTRSLELEKERIETQAKLDRLASLSQMVAGLAHEVNTPLGIINHAANYVTMQLNERQIPILARDANAVEILTDVTEACQLIQGNITRANKLIRSFKDLSVRELTTPRETVDLKEFTGGTLSLYRLKARASRLAIEVSSTEGDWTYDGYPGFFSQILFNLLSNIERYAYPDGLGGRVEIHFATRQDSAEETQIVVTIRDFGNGMSAEIMNEIFTPFFTTGRRIGGVGLGLSIIHNLVTSPMEGAIGVQSEIGIGTTFTIILPKALKESQQVTP